MADALTNTVEEVDSVLNALDGKPIWFPVNGRRWGVRQLTTEEYDQAVHIQNIALKRALAAPEVQDLKNLPPSDDEKATFAALVGALTQRIKDAEQGSPEQRTLLARLARLQKMAAARTLADEVAAEYALVARDRWLTMRLLLRADGTPVFDLTDPQLGAKWNRLGGRVKDAARSAVWEAVAVYENLPFDSEPPPAPSSV